MIGAIIQARRSSSRLPDKVIKKLPFNGNVTVLQQVIRRVKRSAHVKKIVVATTKNEEDKELIRLAEKEKVFWFQGSMDNVLERYFQAAEKNRLDTIVRITSDCPCIDPNVIDWVIEEYIDSKADFASNTLIRTFPHATDVEVFSMDALSRAFHEAKKPWEKEHVTVYIYQNRSLFKLRNVRAPKNCRAPDIRLTLDTVHDYALLCAVFDQLYAENNFFGMPEIVALFARKPWLKLINAYVVQKTLKRSHLC